MASSLSDLIVTIRDWSNRGSDVLSDSTIQTCVRWAVDKAVRRLRIVPLEKTLEYEESAVMTEGPVNGRSVVSIAIPADMIEIISLSTVDSSGSTIRMFDTKADERTFFNPHAEQYNIDALFTRKRDRLYISAAFPETTETKIQLYYYGRPAAIDAKYSVVAANYDGNDTYIQQASLAQVGDEEGFLIIKDSGGNLVTNVANVNDAGNVAEDTTATAEDASQGIYRFIGHSAANWFLDEADKLVTYGALAEVFSYLQEDDQVAKYTQLFEREIADLNEEDRMQNASGGNVQMNFNGRGLI